MLQFSQPRIRNISIMLVAAIAASLPWSTSATAILTGFWLVSLLAILRPEDVYYELRRPAGAFPIALWVIALLGMFWADVSWVERLNGLKPFHKLLILPLLFAQFRQTPRVKPVFGAFLGASVLLVLASWALVLLPGITWRGNNYVGVPVKDYISQSGVFTLCIFGLLWIATERHEKSDRRWIALALAALFLANIVYVAAARTSLIVALGLALLFSIRRFGWRGFLILCVLGTVTGTVFWTSSPYLRERILSVATETEQFQAHSGAETSIGIRLEFWKKSLMFFPQAPWIGHGTGTVGKLFSESAVGKTGVASVPSVNPHNQTFMVGIQLGLLGVLTLYAVWLAHLLLFRGDGLTSWLGMCVVVQNVIGSLFNSHLSDFSQGWVYVIGVGVIGGAVRSRIATLSDASRSPPHPDRTNPDFSP